MKNKKLAKNILLAGIGFMAVILYNEYSSDTASATAPAFASLSEKGAYFLRNPSRSAKKNIDSLLVSESEKILASAAPDFVEMEGSIKRGDTFETSLRRLTLSDEIRQHIISSFRPHIDFKRIDTSDTYTVRVDQNGNLVSAVYEADPVEIYLLEVKDGATTVEKKAIQIETRTSKITGQIKSSLFSSFAELNESTNLVYAFAEIFSSKIDFNTETQKGDKFSLIVDKHYKGDQFVGYGKIQVAQYVMTNGKVREAFYFTPESGSGTYYDGEGKEVGTSFLRSPVPMGKVTSKFTYRRKHPITGKVQPHLGVDLAAPIGTPILASSDGKIIAIGYNGGNGKQIILSHNGGIKTYYGHLSRYKKGLQKGSRVDKKEIIGYVGSSGLSTGPHLDYRISKNGSFMDPFSIDFAPKTELSGAELARFTHESVSQRTALNSYPEKTEYIIQVTNITLTPDQKLALL